MSTVIRPGTLRQVCKEPLAEVQSVQLRGRGITRLVGLSACTKLTSLDISDNSLTELDSASFQGCRELWIVNASNNRLVSEIRVSPRPCLTWQSCAGEVSLFQGLKSSCPQHVCTSISASITA